MSIEIVVPDIGDFESVEIIEVLVKAGSNIKKNDSIVTLESDKSSVEVPSPYEGKISELKVKVGDKVSKGSILALIESKESNNETAVTINKEPKNEKVENASKTKIQENVSVKKENNIQPITEKIIKQAELTETN